MAGRAEVPEEVVPYGYNGVEGERIAGVLDARGAEALAAEPQVLHLFLGQSCSLGD